MIVNLMVLDYVPSQRLRDAGFVVRRAHVVDKKAILEFVGSNFTGEGAWVAECEAALHNSPPSCFLATKGTEIVGFACYDATAKDYFGPLGVHPDYRGLHLGVELLLVSLDAMKHQGYGYAIIGWPSDPKFYAQHAGAIEIPGTEPQNTIYRNTLGVRAL